MDMWTGSSRTIPGEMVGAYVALNGLLVQAAVPAGDAATAPAPAADSNLALFCVAGLLVLTPLYQIFVAKVTKPVQWILSIPAFVIWVMAIGGLVDQLPFWAAQHPEVWLRKYASVGLIFFTLITPMINPGDAKSEAPVQ